MSALELAGTPPRAWGRRRLPHDGGETAGNTPTGVGKTGPSMSIRTSRSEHPHGRGEDLSELRRHGVGYGTPPRAWGRRYFQPWNS